MALCKVNLRMMSSTYQLFTVLALGASAMAAESFFKRCGIPGKALDGFWNQTQSDPFTVIYSCREAFTLHGSGIRRCKDDRTWDNPLPWCGYNLAEHPNTTCGNESGIVCSRLFYLGMPYLRPVNSHGTQIFHLHQETTIREVHLTPRFPDVQLREDLPQFVNVSVTLERSGNPNFCTLALPSNTSAKLDATLMIFHCGSKGHYVHVDFTALKMADYVVLDVGICGSVEDVSVN